MFAVCIDEVISWKVKWPKTQVMNSYQILQQKEKV